MITLTLEESEQELLDGFPEYVTFSTDEPATVYYTLDGSIPSSESLIAVGRVYLPTTGRTVSLSAIAISLDDTSSILEETYRSDSTTLDGPRILGTEGIVVMSYGDDAVDSLSYDADGDDAQMSSTSFSDLEIKASLTDSTGIYVGEGKTSVGFVNFSKKSEERMETAWSSPNDNANFDPNAKFITIDGSTEANLDNQVVKIVNRPYNTFGPVSKFYNERLGEKEPIVTGNYVRSFYNPETKLYVSYYWESLESRWIRSVQTVNKDTLHIGGVGKSFVYRWIQDRALSQLF